MRWFGRHLLGFPYWWWCCGLASVLVPPLVLWANVVVTVVFVSAGLGHRWLGLCDGSCRGDGGGGSGGQHVRLRFVGGAV